MYFCWKSRVTLYEYLKFSPCEGDECILGAATEMARDPFSPTLNKREVMFTSLELAVTCGTLDDLNA